MNTLQDYIDCLTREVLDLDNQISELHVEEWKRPAGKQLLYELDKLTQHLSHAHAFQAAQKAGKGVCGPLGGMGARPHGNGAPRMAGEL
jgi:hypothetical protein